MILIAFAVGILGSATTFLTSTASHKTRGDREMISFTGSCQMDNFSEANRKNTALNLLKLFRMASQYQILCSVRNSSTEQDFMRTNIGPRGPSLQHSSASLS
jgi:hypothetical protein